MDFWGIDQEGDIYDAWAYVNMDSTGKPYFEVFQDGDSENPFLSMYMTIEENGTCIMPDIGTEDAWTVGYLPQRRRCGKLSDIP